MTSDNATMQQRYNATTLLVPDKIGKNVHPSESQWSCDTNLSNNMTGDNCLVLEQRVCPAPVYCKKKKTLLVLLGNVVYCLAHHGIQTTADIFYFLWIYNIYCTQPEVLVQSSLYYCIYCTVYSSTTMAINTFSHKITPNILNMY